MRKELLVFLACLPMLPAVAAAQVAKPLAERVGHADPARYRHSEAVHDGAGAMDFAPLLGASALSTNLLFVHRGVIQPHSGIGQHFHNQCEEMFVILDGEAEFTVDGRTSRLKGPAGVPDRMGHAHGIYNPTDKPLQWLNINVSMTKRYDAFNLKDTRVGAAIDPVPQFISYRLDKSLLKAVQGMNGGTGTVQYRRALDPSVFTTSWSYIDHLIVPPGASVGSVTQPDMSEVYYVISGDGSFTVGSETVAVKAGDAIPVDLDQARSIKGGQAPLEFLIVGVARDLAAKEAWTAARQEPRR
ncbi:cupin domain-containing protein [Sphingomonas quercus]|uniref:Cupin domain-containing protein n=1 Tax=Sphingomonas quercus TaxID=2842451 RepID=A0ABS6BGS6_9SPHN|nr:cupin domain-containing protein [Sphingomonas quercus]MBU3077389.1 cupin domain-containing protein [Sphingomonas quercus]